MDDSTMQALRVVIARGRGRRGWKDPAGWVDERAQLLSDLVQERSFTALASARGIRPEEVTRLVGEACDAVLRGGESSPEADTACVATWRRWCALGDVAACERVRRQR